jgi:hypothetical protein
MTAGGRCRLTGFAAGTGLAFALTRTYLFDLAPAVLALAVVIGMLAGETVTPRPARRRGTAALRPRRVRDYVPRAALIVTALLGAGVAIFAAYRAPERPDHEVQYFGSAEPVSLASTLATLGGVAVLTLLTVWLVVRSAQTGIDDTEHAADEAWRRAIVRRIVHGCAAVFAAVFTALGFWYADGQLDWRGGGSPPWGFGLSLLAGAGLVTFARYAGALAYTQPGADRAMKGSEDILDGSTVG